MKTNVDPATSPRLGAGQKPADRYRLAQGILTGVNVCVVGGGFVGVVSAAGFAEFGHSVVCVEKDPDRLAMLQAGKIPFYERDLEELVQRGLESGRLSFTGDLAQAIKGQRAVFVTVGTPALTSGRTNLGPLEEVVRVLAAETEAGQVVVLKSTVPLGTGRWVQDRLAEGGNGRAPVAVVNNPEFLREGSAVHDFFHPQRIVIGGRDAEKVEAVAHIYRLGMTQPVPIVQTNNETAEMIKYASNAFIALKVGFVNELAGLCDQVDTNVLEVAHAMGMDPRIGTEYLVPGPGWGGSCLGKDLRELEGLAESKDYTPLIIRAIQHANVRHQERIVARVRGLIGTLHRARVAVLGLAFKAGTSDMRDSPAIPIIEGLLSEGASVVAFDPQAHAEARRYLPSVELADAAERVADGADCLLILTEWEEFQSLDFKSMAGRMRRPVLLDARNLLVPESMQRYGFTYAGMGQS
jgi:UDPglucose 6-dehydrogenase